MSRRRAARTDPAPRGDPAPRADPALTVVRIIRMLQEGRLTGASLGTSDRRRVVEHLTAEGYSGVEIAEITGVSERTIERDRSAIRAGYALDVTPEFVGQTIGHLVRQAEVSMGRLRRLARDRAAPAAAKVDAEYAAWRVHREMIAALQRLGCLPDVAIRAEVTHRIGEIDPLEAAPAYEVLEAELARLEQVQAATGGMPASVMEAIDRHRGAIGRLAVSARLEALKAQGSARGSRARDSPQVPVPSERRLT